MINELTCPVCEGQMVSRMRVVNSDSTAEDRIAELELELRKVTAMWQGAERQLAAIRRWKERPPNRPFPRKW